MAEKNKCCIIHICTLRFSRPNLSLTALILISNFNWASEELSEILRKKKDFSPSIMRPQISLQRKLNNIEKSFYNFCQCAARQHLCSEISSHGGNGRQIERK